MVIGLTTYPLKQAGHEIELKLEGVMLMTTVFWLINQRVALEQTSCCVIEKEDCIGWWGVVSQMECREQVRIR